jgi:hypothetical protein
VWIGQAHRCRRLAASRNVRLGRDNRGARTLVGMDCSLYGLLCRLGGNLDSDLE